MSEQGDVGGEGLDAAERERLALGLEARFAAHLDAAAAAVQGAERKLVDAQERLARAEEAAATERYRSDPRVFMRESVTEDLEALERKTTTKKVMAAYRFLLDRAVELAAGEVEGFHDDQAAMAHDRDHGVDACREAEQRAAEVLREARLMQERVRAAEQFARQGLALMGDKLATPPPP